VVENDGEEDSSENDLVDDKCVKEGLRSEATVIIGSEPTELLYPIFFVFFIELFELFLEVTEANFGFELKPSKD
jgi:hypothetical protein